MSDPSRVLSLLRMYKSLTDRHLSLLARQEGMHPTDVSALSHLFDMRRAGEVLTAGELGELLALSGPATTACIDRLERRGFVQRRQSTVDGRRVEVHLVETVAPQGNASMFIELERAVRRVLDKHSAAEVKGFEAILSDLCDSLDAMNRQ